MWCRLAGISGCTWPHGGPHCPHWCPPRGPCGRLSLQVGCRLGCLPGFPWPPGWREQLPVGLPGREMLTLTAGVRSPPALGWAVAPPTLGSCLMGSPGLEPVTPRPQSLQKSPTTSWDTQALGQPTGRAGPLRREGWAGASGDTGYTLPWEGPPQNSTWSPHGCQVDPPRPLGLPHPPDGGQVVVGLLGPRPSAARQLCCGPGVSIRDACVPAGAGRGATGVYSPADAHSPPLGYELACAPTCVSGPPVRPHAWTRVLAPHAHTGRRRRHAHCTLRLSPNQRLSPRLPQNPQPFPPNRTDWL